jgi:hypothetical protein
MTHHFTLDNIYDRPEMVGGDTIATISGGLYEYHVGDASETMAVVSIVPDTPFEPVTYRLVHDPCAYGHLTLTGGVLIGTPTYNTYSTVFSVMPTASTMYATLTGFRVDIIKRDFVRQYPVAKGENHTFECPIASDSAVTGLMYDRYHGVASATKYNVKLRDDPSVEVNDRVLLDTLEHPTGITTTVSDIKRTFDGGISGEYTLVEVS